MTPRARQKFEGAGPYVAFGAQPQRRATYELRQARYYALGEDVAREAATIALEHGRRCRLLDVGVFDGVSRRFTELHPGNEAIDYEGVDIYPYGVELVYKHQDWTLHDMNLLGGMPGLSSDAYDVVICEQVLEHLTNVQPALRDLVRVLKPGGMLIVGVPIFPEGLHLIRKYVIPVTDRIFKVKKVRGHVQAWSLRTFTRELRQYPELEIQKRRGFRIVSGGILRPLEFTRWWWRFNVRLGSWLPALCAEVQIVCRKQAEKQRLIYSRDDLDRKVA